MTSANGSVPQSGPSEKRKVAGSIPALATISSRRSSVELKTGERNLVAKKRHACSQMQPLLSEKPSNGTSLQAVSSSPNIGVTGRNSMGNGSQYPVPSGDANLRHSAPTTKHCRPPYQPLSSFWLVAIETATKTAASYDTKF